MGIVKGGSAGETPQAIMGFWIGLPVSAALWACIVGLLLLIAF